MIDLKGIRKAVYEVIQRNPQAANDDAVLLERYWIEVDGWDENKSLYWNLSKVTRPETITRRRRELHNMGLINYSDQANDFREEAFINERDNASTFVPQAVSWLNDCGD